MDSFKNEGTKTVKIEGGIEAARSHNEVIFNGKETIRSSLATNAEIRSDTFNNVRPKIRSAINEPNLDTTPDSATLQMSMQLQKDKIQINLYRTRT